MPIPLGILAVAGAGAAGGGSAFDLLTTTLISSNTASVTFSNLNTYSGYKHLQIRYTARDSFSNSQLLDMAVRFNSDTGSNYARHRLNGDGSSVTSNNDFNASSIGITDAIAGATSTTNAFGVGIIDILDFGSSSKTTTLRALNGGSLADESDITLQSGLWNNTAAVTSVSLIAVSNFVSGSRFSLYGIR